MHLRRAVALVLGLLAVPSLYWSVVWPFAHSGEAGWLLNWAREIFFVLSLAVAAMVAWRASRYWQLIVLAVVALHTYLVAWQFIDNVLLTPAHWSHFELVLREAARRGFEGGGPGLIWSLIVLPLALPALLIFSVWLCIPIQRTRSES